MKIVCLIACACLLSLSCSDDSNPVDKSESIVALDYLPIYDTDYLLYKDLIDPILDSTSEYWVGNEHTQVVLGDTVRIVSYESEDGYVYSEYFASEAGVHRKLRDLEDFLQIQSGIVVGSTWENVTNDEEKYVSTLVEIRENVTIQAVDGTSAAFEHVIVIDMKSDTFGVQRRYYVKGIGLVYSQLNYGEHVEQAEKLLEKDGVEFVWE